MRHTAETDEVRKATRSYSYEFLTLRLHFESFPAARCGAQTSSCATALGGGKENMKKELSADMATDNSEDIYKRSRFLYIFEAAFEYFTVVLASGAYLAKLTSAIGISDSMTAVLTALTSLAGAAQVVSIYLSHKPPTKRWVLPIKLASQLLFASLFLIPFLSIRRSAMPAIFFVIMLLARVLYNVANPLKTTWFMNLVPMRKRGFYQSVLTAFSLIGGAIVSYVAGVVIDRFEANGDINGAFLTITVMILFFALVDVSTLIFSREKPAEKPASTEEHSIISSIRFLAHDRKYKKCLLVFLLVSIANNVITPFLGTYQINELGFSMKLVSVTTIIFNLVYMVTILIFGMLSRNFQHKTILRIAYPIFLVAYIVNIFTAPSNGVVMFIVYSVILNVGTAANAVSDTNIVLEIIPREEQTAALSLKMIITGTLGFLVTLAVSPFIDFMQARGNQLFGSTVYAQQVLSALAAFIYLLVVICYNVILVPELNGKENRVHHIKTFNKKADTVEK